MTKKKVKRSKDGQFAKGAKPGPGRPKKIKGTGKPMEDFIAIYQGIGGLEEFKRWAVQNNSNQAAFYQMLFRTVPKEVAADLLLPKHVPSEGPLQIQYVNVELKARIDQLEAFIVGHSLEVPEQVKRKFPSDAEGGKDSGNGT